MISEMTRPLIDLPETPRRPLRFLGPEATPAQLIRATAANHTRWFAAGARAEGGEVRRTGGVACAVSPTAMTIAFPRLSADAAGPVLDTIVGECYARRLKGASCWSLCPTRPRDLGARVAARGFEWGWQPHWMALDLEAMRDDFPVPDGLHIVVDDVGDWDVDDMPYYDRSNITVLQALARERPRRTWHFGAWLNGRVVGHSVLFLTTGALGVAGIYSVGVVPAARNQGIGRAISLAPCQFARALRARWATLNAATHIYDRLGFRSLGYGQTWWMHTATLNAPPPTPDQIAFAEAIVRGNIKGLDSVGAQAFPPDLDAPLPNGMTPLALAVKARQPAATEWLIAHGATPDIVQVWDLGWKDRVPGLLAERPELANRRAGHWQNTPLHEAALRGDAELARLVLAADPDLDIRDTQYHSTPLGWAQHLGQTEVAALIEEHIERTK